MRAAARPHALAWRRAGGPSDRYRARGYRRRPAATFATPTRSIRCPAVTMPCLIPWYGSDVVEVPISGVAVPARRRALSVSERRLLLATVDLLAVSLAFVAAFNLRTAVVRGAGFYVPRLGTLVVCGLWLLASRIADAYDLRSSGDLRAMARTVATTVSLTFLGMLLVFLVAPYRITRPTMLLWVPLAGATVVGGRLAYRRVLGIAAAAERIVLVMSGDALATVWPEVAPTLHNLYRVVGVVDPGKPGSSERLHTLVRSRQADQLVLGVRDDISRDLFRDLLVCHEAGLRIRSLADLYEELTGRLLLDQLGHTWLMALPMRGQTSRLYGWFKRALDVVAATAALVLLGLLLPPLALLLWLDDPGPLWHRQTRVGQYGRCFELLKLRTMRATAPDRRTWTQDQDPRVTRVGRVLRALHLDELPQAWAILRGDMSLVGPRPEQPHYVAQLRREIDFYPTRLTVRPGLTGWAQVNYGYGSGVDGARVKLSYDLYYIKHQSVSLDLVILGKTLLAVLALEGR